MHTVFALLCFFVVIHWLIFPYPSGLLHWHCGNLTIAPVPAKQPWWICTKGQQTRKMFPFDDVIKWTALHLHYSEVIYKRHCAWHLSHSTQCLYEGLWRLTTKEASGLAFPISCEGTPILSGKKSSLQLAHPCCDVIMITFIHDNTLMRWLRHDAS